MDNQLFLFAEITSPNYPNSYEDNKLCTFSVQSEPGSQISVNFIDVDLQEPDFEMNCISDFLQVTEDTNLPSTLIGNDGLKICGKRLPNSPGPSVVVSGKYQAKTNNF